MSTKGTLFLKQQECEGNYNFESVQHYMTRGFFNLFGDLAVEVASASLTTIMEKHPDNADYFQVLVFVFPNGEAQEFYCIHDETHVTFLLPDEY